jgi:putative hydrolase of the HAD superfamily
MPPVPIGGVFFDLVGTLIRVRGSVGRQYAAMAARFGIAADPDAIDRVFPAALAGAFQGDGPGRSPARAAAAEREAWRGILRRVFEQTGAIEPEAGSRPLAPPGFDACFEALFDYFATAGPWQLYPDALPALDRAHAAGLRLGLITNFDARVFPLLEDLRLSDRFDVVAIPAVAGASKPDAAIFHYAVARLHLDPAEATHVGDSEVDDARAASAAGLRGVWLDRSASLSPPGGGRLLRPSPAGAASVITSLDALRFEAARGRP